MINEPTKRETSVLEAAGEVFAMPIGKIGEWGIGGQGGRRPVGLAVCLKRTVKWITCVRVLALFLLAIIIYFAPATGVSRAEDGSPIPVQLPQKNPTVRQGQVLEGAQAVRPTLKERDAVNQLLSIKPRPKTLTDADMKYLKNLREKPTWLGIERRIVHEMWAELNGTEWRDPEVPQPSRNDKSP